MIQQPTGDRPRPNNMAPPARQDAEYAPAYTPGERRAWGAGYRMGRHRGRIDAWMQWTGHRIPGAEPIPEPVPELIGWRDIAAALRQLLRRRP